MALWGRRELVLQGLRNAGLHLIARILENRVSSGPDNTYDGYDHGEEYDDGDFCGGMLEIKQGPPSS